MEDLFISFDSFQEKISKEGYRDIKWINKQMKKYIHNFSDIMSKYKKYDMDDRSKLIDKQKQLEEDIINAREKIHQLEIEIIENKNIINKSVKIGTDFINKIKCILSLRKTFNELLGTFGYIGGSLIRQMFELPMALSESFKTPGYGNPIGRDIDIYLYKYQKDNLSTELREKVREMNNFIRFHKLSPHTFPAIKFGEYELMEITDSTLTEILESDMIGKKKLLNIPHYLFILKDVDNIQITIDVLGWKPESDIYWPNYDFDVNKIYMTEHGFECDDFDNTLNHIINKEADCVINLKLLHNTLSDIAPKSEKISKLNQLIFFLTNRMKLIGTGYKICGKDVPNIFIEEKECCIISGLNAPYLSLNLMCNHQISIMTFIGIVNEINDYTEAIRCPYCRDSILIKFNDIEFTNIISWTPIEPPVESVHTTVQKSDEIQLFSSESKEYIQNILLKRESNILPNNIQRVAPNNIPTIALNNIPTVGFARPQHFRFTEIPRTSTRLNSTNNSMGFTFSS
jgi:hypothetical protein